MFEYIRLIRCSALAPTFIDRVTLLVLDFDVIAGVWRVLIKNLSLDLACQNCKNLLNVIVGLRRSLDEIDFVALGEVLALLGVDHLVFNVALIAYEDLRNVARRFLLDRLHPILDILEASSIGEAVDQNDASSTFVISGCDCPESLLTCGIPDL